MDAVRKAPIARISTNGIIDKAETEISGLHIHRGAVSTLGITSQRSCDHIDPTGGAYPCSRGANGYDFTRYS